MAKKVVKPQGLRVTIASQPQSAQVRKVTTATCSGCTFSWISAEGHEGEPDQSMTCPSCRRAEPMVLERVTLYAVGAKVPVVKAPKVPVREVEEVFGRGRNKDGTQHWSGCRCKDCV